MSDEQKLFPVQGLKEAVGHAGSEAVEGEAESSAFFFQDGRLMLRSKGKLFPAGGGVECGGWTRTVDVTLHLEEIIQAALKRSGE